jgi:hypothetical protein
VLDAGRYAFTKDKRERRFAVKTRPALEED